MLVYLCAGKYFYTKLSLQYKLHNEKRPKNCEDLSSDCNSVNVAQQSLHSVPVPSSCQASLYSPLDFQQQNETST
jgi:hypothetical protein